MSDDDPLVIAQLRIEALHANSAACMKENRKLKAENASLRGSLENLQQRLRPYTPDGLVAKEDVSRLFQALRHYLAALRGQVDAENWNDAYDSLYCLDDTMDGFSYLADDD